MGPRQSSCAPPNDREICGYCGHGGYHLLQVGDPRRPGEFDGGVPNGRTGEASARPWDCLEQGPSQGRGLRTQARRPESCFSALTFRAAAGDFLKGSGPARMRSNWLKMLTFESFQRGPITAISAQKTEIFASSASNRTSSWSQLNHTTRSLIEWCPRGDSNPHAVKHRLLRPACLPVPPPGQKREGKRQREGLRRK